MSHKSEKESERERDEGETSEDFELINHPDEKKSNADVDIIDDTDLEPIEPYKDTDNITEPLYNTYEPKDIASSSRIQNQGFQINSEEGANKANSKCENGQNKTVNSGDNENSREDEICVQITPQMIVASLKRLHYLKYLLSLEELMGYISRHYPVQINKDELKEELTQKIRCACHLGFVKEVHGNYRLTADREKLHLKKSDFRAFWESYLKNPKNVKELKFKNSKKEPRKSERLKEKKTKRKHESGTEKTALSKSKRLKFSSNAPSSSRSSTPEDVPTCSSDIPPDQDDNSISSEENKTETSSNSSSEQ